MAHDLLDPRRLAPEPRFTLREMLAVFFKDRHRIAAAFCLPVLLALVATAATSPRFEASSSLLVRIGREYIYRPDLGAADGPGLAFDREQTLKSEVAILTSRDLIEGVLAEMGLERLYPALAGRGGAEAAEAQEEALAAFRDRLDALLLTDSNVIRVTFGHRDPEVAAEAVNRLVGGYLERRRGLFFDPRVTFLEERVAHFKDRLAVLEVEAEEFRRSRGIVAYDNQRALLLEQRADLNMRLKAALNVQAEIGQKLATTRDNVAKAEHSGRPSLLQAVEKEILELETHAGSAEAGIAVLTGQLADADAQIATLARSKREFDGLERELALAAESYQTYARKLEEARILEERDLRQSANVRVIQPARPPAEPKSWTMAILAMGVAAGLGAALAVAFLSDWLRATFITPEAAERGLGLPVLASFPLEGEPPRRPLLRLLDARPPSEASQ